MLMIFLSCLAIANAQGLFQYERIDFFEGQVAQIKAAVPKESGAHPETIESEWAESVVSPSGKVSIYLPPKEVRNFLENPSPENAKSYLEWNLNRLKKLSLAQQMLNQVAMESADAQMKPAELGNLSRFAALRGKENYLVYFMLKGCPACVRQTKVIEDIHLSHQGVKVQGVGNGFSDRELEEFSFPVSQDNGLSKEFKINTYPSIAVFNKKGKVYLLSGYADESKILSLLE